MKNNDEIWYPALLLIRGKPYLAKPRIILASACFLFGALSVTAIGTAAQSEASSASGLDDVTISGSAKDSLSPSGAIDESTPLQAEKETLTSKESNAASTKEVSKDAELEDLSLESLMNTKVTSVSRKAELFSDVPAALTVITEEDIRRSGLSNLPEVLRLVPGLYVGRISAHTWAISARGLSSEFSNLLLVLIDGRTVYNPSSSGVYWDAQDIMLEDVERIEVIRGPGAAVWGANAVNGVINIITKSAKDTQGALLTTRIGSHEKNGTFRYGTKIGKNAFGRFYVKRSQYNETTLANGSEGSDAWDLNRAGFRIDWEKNLRDTFTFQGDINRGKGENLFSFVSLDPPMNTFAPGQVTNDTLNLLGRWTRILGKDSDMSLQMYYDRSDHRIPWVDNKSEQFDIDFNHRFRLNPKHEIVWGLGYRKTKVAFRNSFEVSINPSRNKSTLYSAFIQDDITLSEDKLRLVLGTKVEHNNFTGFEIQPTGRLVWTPDSKQTAWAAVSKAARTPNFYDMGLRNNFVVFPNLDPAGPPVLLTGFPVSSPQSEKLVAHEIGYRVQPNERLIIDATAFYNRYNNRFGVVPGAPFFELDPAPTHVVVPFYAGYSGRLKTQGLEVSTTWKATDRWKLMANYSFLKGRLITPTIDTDDIEYPKHNVRIHSSHDLDHNLSLDIFASFSSQHGFRVVPGHKRVDVRLGWKPSPDVDLSIGVQNLTRRQHQESLGYTGIPNEIPRSFYVQGAWKF